MTCSVALHDARALPFVKVGPALGYGVGILNQAEDLDQSISTVAAGVSALLDIPLVKLEVDALYWRRSYESTGTLGMGLNITSESTSSFLSVPVIVRYNLSPVPLFDLGIGGGYERRFFLGDHGGDDAQLSYLPLSVRADFKVPLLASLGAELRFSYDLGDAEQHDLMALAHLAF